jgi:hypothetical protein
MHHLTVALFATSDANHTTHMNDYIAGADAMLAKHSMKLEVYPTNPGGGARVLPYTGAVFNSAGDPGAVRQQCHVAVPKGRGIPVIFCKRNTDSAASGGIELGSMIPTSNSEANNGVGWPPYVLINTQGKSQATRRAASTATVRPPVSPRAAAPCARFPPNTPTCCARPISPSSCRRKDRDASPRQKEFPPP